MRKSLVLAIVAVLVCSSTVLAGVPSPAKSGCGLSPSTVACQYVFYADGSLDVLTASITLRDAFDAPVPSCSTTVTLTPNTGTNALCACPKNPEQLSMTTNASGIGVVSWSSIGGNGSLDVCVTAHCQGNIGITCKTIQFTAPDLDALSNLGPCSTVADAVNAGDLAAWSTGISPYDIRSDYDCNLTVNGADLATWSGGLSKPCIP